MNKKLFAVVCIALLVLSFAAARVVNFQLGPSFSFFKGETPMTEEINVPYKGTAFGVDTGFDLTFGPRAEVYFQENVNFSLKSVFGDNPKVDESWNTASIDYKGHLGFEYAVITDPVKLSVGGGLAFELVSSIYQTKIDDEDYSLIVLDFNLGVGATVKAEFPIANHWAAYVRANIDYFPFAGFSMTTSKSSEEPYSNAGKANNFGIDAAAGIVLYF